MKTVIEMAREAGFRWHTHKEQLVVQHTNGSYVVVDEMLERFAALVREDEREANGFLGEQLQASVEAAVLAEREACAKVCEDYPGTLHQWTDKRKTFAAAIRARSDK